jgi:hypothetical protein
MKFRSWIILIIAFFGCSKPSLPQNDYGYYWWHYFWKGNWTAHIASGWRGQRIAVFPHQGIVLTMTADIEDGTEDKVFGDFKPFWQKI